MERPQSPKEEGELDDGESSEEETSVFPSTRLSAHPARIQVLVQSRNQPEQRAHPPPWSHTRGPGPRRCMGLSPGFRFRWRGRGAGSGSGPRPRVLGNNRMAPSRSRPPHGKPLRSETYPEETFDELLQKYKVIQQELEELQREEWKSEGSIDLHGSPHHGAVNPVPAASSQSDYAGESVPSPTGRTQLPQSKGFCSFQLKPLRKRVPTPAELDELNGQPRTQRAPCGPQDEEQNRQPVLANSTEGAAKENTFDVNQDGCLSDVSKKHEAQPGTLFDVEGKEEEELSELQLRLVALQSASRRWQQKEREAMRESHARLGCSRHAYNASRQPAWSQSARFASSRVWSGSRRRSSSTRSGSGSRERWVGGEAGKTALPTTTVGMVRRRRLTEEREEEKLERRRQEAEEIRRIRDLPDADEQYTRFMEIIGSSDNAHANLGAWAVDGKKCKSLEKPHVPEVTVCQFQQEDNYEEVAMEVESETGSPIASPYSNRGSSPATVHHLFLPLYSASHTPPPLSACPTAPLPPPLPAEEPAKPPPLPADEEPDEEKSLRLELLQSLGSRRRAVASEAQLAITICQSSEDTSTTCSVPTPVPTSVPTSSVKTVVQGAQGIGKPARVAGVQRKKIKLPQHKTVVVRLGEDTESESDYEAEAFGGLERMIKEARRTAENPLFQNAYKKPRTLVQVKLIGNEEMHATPDSLPEDKKVEYRRLKAEIVRREKEKALRKCNSAVPSPIPSDTEVDPARPVKTEATTPIKLVAANRKEPAGNVNGNIVLRVKDGVSSMPDSKFPEKRSPLRAKEAILQQLQQQYERRSNILHQAEARLERLREQLQATERVVLVNRTALRHLAQQVNKAQQCVHKSEINTKSAIAKSMTTVIFKQSAPTKRRAQTSVESPKLAKRLCIDNQPSGLNATFGNAACGSKLSAEFIASEKLRLQRLELEYAEKIRRLKAAQHASKRKTVTHKRIIQAVAQPTVKRLLTQPANKPAAQKQAALASTSQPSLHDLSQDKLSLGPAAEGEGSNLTKGAAGVVLHVANAEKPHDATLTTRPNLVVGAEEEVRIEVGAAKRTNGNGNSLRIDGAAMAKSHGSVPSGKENFHKTTSASDKGLNAEGTKATKKINKLPWNSKQLGKMHAEAPGLEEMIKGFCCALFPKTALSSPSAARAPKLNLNNLFRPSPEGQDQLHNPSASYHSALLTFRSYRFSPYFRTKHCLHLSSSTYSHKINPMRPFCPFDLAGTCNDDTCSWQHMKECQLSRDELFVDILSYNLNLIGCTERSTASEIRRASAKYVEQLFGGKECVSDDHIAVLLVSRVNESLNHKPPHTTMKEQRTWRPLVNQEMVSESSDDKTEDEDDERHWASIAENVKNKAPKGLPELTMLLAEACDGERDARYFFNGSDDAAMLESAVLESPNDTKLWLRLAYCYLGQDDSSGNEGLPTALNALSRALELNRSSTEMWSHYLALFAAQGSHLEVQQMFEVAVQYAPSYQLWWQYLSLEHSFEGKNFVSSCLQQYLMTKAEAGSHTRTCSRRLLETLLYRVQLHMCSGRLQAALAIFQEALKAGSKRHNYVAMWLSRHDRALAWLSYLHIVEFNRLPEGIEDPMAPFPGHLVCSQLPLIPWNNVVDLYTAPDTLLALLNEALTSCQDAESGSGGEEGEDPFVAIYRNMARLLLLCSRQEEAFEMCMRACNACPASMAAVELRVEVLVAIGDGDSAAEAWLEAWQKTPSDPKLAYYTARFLCSVERIEESAEVLRVFIESLYVPIPSETCHTGNLYRSVLACLLDGDFQAPSLKDEVSSLTFRASLPFVWLNFCCWQRLCESQEAANEAFEIALGSVTEGKSLQLLWHDYLSFRRDQLHSSSPPPDDGRAFVVLLQRCLLAVPVRRSLLHEPSLHYYNYSFHNQVSKLLLDCVSPSQHVSVLEWLLYLMPSNVFLAVRLCAALVQEGSLHQLAAQAKQLAQRLSYCLCTWKIAVAAESKCGRRKTVRWLFREALHRLPLCANLWKDVKSSVSCLADLTPVL
uniref:Putative zinc-finger domain-containing protein n=1 Tax=Eptatretus burgeri TaxID=7764 RepID=A0A8C4ND19_EPTBU